MKSVKEGIFRNRCPLCGGRIIVSDLYQYSIDYTVGSRGKLLKKAKKVDCGSMEVSIAACENGDAIWEAGDFYIVDDYFVDCKFDGGKEDKKG